MKILQLCMRVLFPPGDGATIAMYNAAAALLAEGAELKILAFNTSKNHVSPEQMRGPFAEKTSLETVDLHLGVSPVAAFLNLFSRSSIHVNRFVSQPFREKLEQTLARDEFDIVQLEGLYMTPYTEVIRAHSRARIVLRAHNVEHVIWQRLAAGCRQPLRKMYLSLLARKLAAYEKQAVSRVDALLPITGVDHELFVGMGCRKPMFVLPVGVDAGEYPPSTEAGKEFTVFHVGSMDWRPNLEGVDWFLDRVYPGLIGSIPDCHVILAGKDMPARILEKAGGPLEVNGRIDGFKSFMQDKSVMIVPLLSGGGMRVKIIEGLAAGKAIVSTTVGAEGIRCTAGKDILLADSPGEFREALIGLYRDPGRRPALGAEARKLAEAEYDNAVLGRRLMDFYRDMLK